VTLLTVAVSVSQCRKWRVNAGSDTTDKSQKLRLRVANVSRVAHATGRNTKSFANNDLRAVHGLWEQGRQLPRLAACRRWPLEVAPSGREHGSREAESFPHQLGFARHDRGGH